MDKFRPQSERISVPGFSEQAQNGSNKIIFKLKVRTGYLGSRMSLNIEHYARLLRGNPWLGLAVLFQIWMLVDAIRREEWLWALFDFLFSAALCSALVFFRRLSGRAFGHARI